MNWKALKDFKCPKDGGTLEGPNARGYIKCQTCDFYIGKEKFNTIVKSMPTRQHTSRTDRRDEVEENLSDLNNLGHKKQSLHYDQPDT